MWSEVLTYVTILLYFHSKLAIVQSKSFTSVYIATVQPQYQTIDLSTNSNSWYIIGKQTTDTINITLTDVKIGIGHAGFVGECAVDFVSIFDTNKSSESGLKICGNTVKDAWKGWQSASNNVSIIYTTKTFGRFGYYVQLKYLRNRHICRHNRTICSNGKCLDANNKDGYACVCELGYTGKNCDQREEPVFEILQATNESKIIIFNSSDTSSWKRVWIITAAQNHIINITLSFGNKKNPSSYHKGSSIRSTSSFISIRDTNVENHIKNFSQSDLQSGVLWLSQSNNVSIECDEMCQDINISYAAPPEVQLIRVSSEVKTLKLNHRSNRKHRFIAEEGYNINLFLSVSGEPATIPVDSNHSECIKIYDESRNASLSINDLLMNGVYNWPSSSNEVTIERNDKYRDTEFTIRFQNIWKQCESLPCENDGKCSANPPNSYLCTCTGGFDGKRCEKISGEHCEANTYTVPFTKHIFHWKDTFPGSIATLPCPVNYIGNATRVCAPSNYSEYGGKWNKPNLSECVSKEIQMIDNEANILQYTNSISSVVFNNLTTRLTAATSKFSEIDMYPGDLTTATHAVHTLSQMVESISPAETSELSTVAQGYGEAVGNIIDPSLIDVWTYTTEDAVQNNMLSILTSVERMSANVAKKKVYSLHRKKREISKFTTNETVHVKANNLEFHISLHEKIAICEDSFSLTLGDDTSSGVTLSSAVFKAAIENTADRYIQVYNARFSSIAEVIDASRSVQPDVVKSGKSTPYINSDILSSRILNIEQSRFENLAQPVIIMLEIKNKTESLDLKEKCVFVNMSSSDHNIWTDRGCKVDYLLSNRTHIACKCTHLTNFAVLMDVFEVQKDIDYTDYTILTYITYVGGVMSALACIITVIVFQFFSLRKERVLVHQQLALAIVLVQVFFLVGIDRTENKYVCIVMAALLHYSVISMFCWMLIEGFHLYIMLVKVFRRKANFRKYVIFGWGFPLVVVGISLGVFHDQYGGPDRCWLSHDILLMAFVPVVSLVIVINTIILIIVLRIMMKSMLSRANSEERSAIKAGLKAAAILLPLLGTTWTLGFFSINSRDTLIFTYLFTFFNSLQGVFFFVFHCLLNTDVKNAFERRSQRRSLTKLLEESLNQDSRTRKSSTLNTALTSKSSIKSILTDESLPWKRKQKMSNNDMDRIHRENIAELKEKQYHQNLQRSFSDGIPRWQNVNKDFHFYTGKENINILNAHPFHKSDKFNENGHLIGGQPSHQTNENSKDFRIEDLYTKPTRKVISLDNSSNQKDNRVRFDEMDSKSEGVVNKAFVQELKERTSSIQT